MQQEEFHSASTKSSCSNHRLHSSIRGLPHNLIVTRFRLTSNQNLRLKMLWWSCLMISLGTRTRELCLHSFYWIYHWHVLSLIMISLWTTAKGCDWEVQCCNYLHIFWSHLIGLLQCASTWDCPWIISGNCSWFRMLQSDFWWRLCREGAIYSCSCPPYPYLVSPVSLIHGSQIHLIVQMTYLVSDYRLPYTVSYAWLFLCSKQILTGSDGRAENNAVLIIEFILLSISRSLPRGKGTDVPLPQGSLQRPELPHIIQHTPRWYSCITTQGIK